MKTFLGLLLPPVTGFPSPRSLKSFEDEAVMADLRTRSARSPEAKGIPTVVWLRLFHDFAPYLIEKGRRPDRTFRFLPPAGRGNYKAGLYSSPIPYPSRPLLPSQGRSGMAIPGGQKTMCMVWPNFPYRNHRPWFEICNLSPSTDTRRDWTSLERVKAFGQFIGTHLERIADGEEPVFQIAWNSAASGPVAERVARMKEEGKGLWGSGSD